MIAPTLGGLLRSLSERPVPTLNVYGRGELVWREMGGEEGGVTLPDPIRHVREPVTPLFLPFPAR